MILVGNQRGGSADLARHLMKTENERVTVHELRGFISTDLAGALHESYAVSRGTRCKQHLYSMSLNPPKDANPETSVFMDAIGRAEVRLGLEGQPRAIVFHEKRGADGEIRRHAHAVWCRIDVERMKAIQLSHDHRKLNGLARDLYVEHGWSMPRGFAKETDPRNYGLAEWQQAKRAGQDPAALKGLFQKCWAMSDTQASFAHALKEQGYILARGDRRGVVAVDRSGEVYAVARYIGIKTKEVRARIRDTGALPDVETAQQQAAALTQKRVSKPAVPQKRVTTDTLAQLAAERREIIETHRENLKRQLAEQRARRNAEALARQARIRSGWQGFVDRMTGVQSLIDAQHRHAEQKAQQRDQAERQKLRDEYQAMRRALADQAREAKARYRAVIAAPAPEPNATISKSKNPDAPPPIQQDVLKQRTYSLDPRQPLVLPPDTAPFSPATLQKKPDLILDYLSQKQASFTRTDILRALADKIDDPLQLRTAAERAMASPELIASGDAKSERYTTRDYQRIEARLNADAAALARSGGFAVNTSHADRAIARRNADLKRRYGAGLSAEQTAAIRHVLAPRQLAAVVGLAGAGKSTMLEAARDGWERQGYKVHGAALSGKAADGLQSASGIASRTLASLELSWANGNEPIGHGDVLVIDEAGMVGTRQLARVTAACKDRSCKLVLVGDPEQVQPIEAGTPFRAIASEVGAARLKDIRRQKPAWQRRASLELANGKTTQAIDTYARKDKVRIEVDRGQAIASLVADYVGDIEMSSEPASRLALAHRRKDVHAINQTIRAAKKDAGGLEDEVLFATDHGPRAFASGERLLFTRNDAKLGVRNGMLGTVEVVDAKRITVRLDGDELGKGRAVTVAPKDFPAIDHGYAVSIHRAQGATVDKTYVLSSKSLDRHLAYVALTRHKHDTRFYTAPEIRPRGMAKAGLSAEQKRDAYVAQQRRIEEARITNRSREDRAPDF